MFGYVWVSVEIDGQRCTFAFGDGAHTRCKYHPLNFITRAAIHLLPLMHPSNPSQKIEMRNARRSDAILKRSRISDDSKETTHAEPLVACIISMTCLGCASLCNSRPALFVVLFHLNTYMMGRHLLMIHTLSA